MNYQVISFTNPDVHTTTSEAWRNLSNAIVMQAVDDWMTLCRMVDDGIIDMNGRFLDNKHKYPGFSFSSLRNFFNGAYCDMLCGDVDPMIILDELERRRKTKRLTEHDL